MINHIVSFVYQEIKPADHKKARIKMATETNNTLGLEKATLVLINTVGFPVARQITVQRSEVQNKRLVLQYVEKGKRKATATRFYPDTQLAIYPGWHSVDGAINNTGTGDWTQFEAGAFKRMTDSVKVAPVYTQGNE